MSKKIISVIICTYDNVPTLTKSVGSIVNQIINKNLYELIIIDNSKNSRITELKKIFSKKDNPRIKIYREKLTGLGHARNKGVGKAEGKYLAFLDDDAYANSRWLRKALSDFEINPTPIALGGVIIPIYSKLKPLWFKDNYEKRSWGAMPRFLGKGESFSGSNMFFDKETVIKYKGFNVKVGMKETKLMLGEETALFEKIWDREKRSDLFYYDPDLIVYHNVQNEKLTVDYQLKRSFAAGQSWWIRKERTGIFFCFYTPLKYLTGLIYTIFLFLVSFYRYKHWQQWVVEKLSPVFYILGVLMSILGINITVYNQKRV